MANLKDKFVNAKDKVMGEAKESVGKTTGSEETELNGKIQSKKADFKKKFDGSKEKIIKKINDALDEKEENKNK